MKTTEGTFPVFDCTKIPFPSDRLSVGHLRQLFPVHFDDCSVDYVQFFPEEGKPPAESIAFSKMLHKERRLAQITFEDAVIANTKAQKEQQPMREHEVNAERKDCAQLLVKEYRRFGIAPGAEAARQLIRQFQNKVVEEANRQSKGRFGSR